MCALRDFPGGHIGPPLHPIVREKTRLPAPQNLASLLWLELTGASDAAREVMYKVQGDRV
jgi:hypothetical protein